MRNNLRSFALVLFFIFFVVAVSGGLFWGNLNFSKTIHAGTDFVALWKPAQNYILNGVSPYDPANALQIQRLIYGRPAGDSELTYRFSQPFYVVLLFFPVGWIRNLVVSRAIWMIFLEMAVAGVVFLSLSLSRWKPSWFFLFLVLLFSLFWAPSAVSIVDGNFVIFQALFVFGAVSAIASEADELAGALAALALVYLDITGLALALLAFWVFSARRWRVLAGFLMTLTLLVLVSFLIYPTWFPQFFFAALNEWRAHLLPSTFNLLEIWFPGIGVQLAQGLRAIAIIILFFEWQAVRGKGAHWLYWTVSLTAALTPYFGVNLASSWLVFTLPALILVLSVMGQRWGPLGRLGALLLLGLFFAGLWTAYIPRFDAIFIFIYPLVMAVLLYWVRWWATRPPRLWMDMVSQGK